MRMGYIIEFSKKNGIFGDFEPRRKYLCTTERLIILLQEKVMCGTVWSAKLCDIDEYTVNHDGEVEFIN